MLVVTQDEISLSKYCMMFSLQPSNAQQLSPLSEIMILTSGASVQYKSSHNPFYVSEKAFLKMAVRISKWQADEL